MKKSFTLIITMCILFYQPVLAQLYTNGANVNSSTTGNENVGIGTNDPKTELHVQGGIASTRLGDSRPQVFMQGTNTIANGFTRGILSSKMYWDNSTSNWQVIDPTYNDFSAIMFGNNGWITFVSQAVNPAAGTTFTHNQVIQNTRLKIDPEGRVYIGSGLWGDVYYSDYRLYVEKGIRTEKVKVDLNTSWADYVFDSNYELMPLDELAKFVEKEKHLPNVPSEKELQTEGIDLAQMDKIQMEKIEELTLYIIQLKKQNLVLEERLKALEQKLKK